MKHLRLKQFGVFAFLGISSLVAAKSTRAETYTTNRGVVFTEVDFSGFGPSWQDPNGNIWSGNQGEFTMVQDLTAVPPVQAPAILACLKIGGHLPSLTEFKSLVGFFYQGALSTETTLDRADFSTLFPNWTAYWTSDRINSIGWTRTVDGMDTFGDPRRDGQTFEVRCVGRQ